MKTTIRVVDWIIFLVLFGLAVYWTVDAIEKYNLKRTTMSQSFEPITQSPTIVICWDSIYHYVYKDHFSVGYQSNLFGIEKGAHLLELDEEKTFNKTKETVLLQQSQLSCFKISSKLAKQDYWKLIQLYHKRRIPNLKDLPRRCMHLLQQ